MRLASLPTVFDDRRAIVADAQVLHSVRPLKGHRLPATTRVEYLTADAAVMATTKRREKAAAVVARLAALVVHPVLTKILLF